MKTESVIFPGSFDPITLGHEEMLRKMCEMYAKVYIVAFNNTEKVYRFTPKQRLEMLRLTAEKFENAVADISDGYVVDYVREHEIGHIVKGIRSEKDLAYERIQEDFNFTHGGILTEYLTCGDGLKNVSSTLARERIRSGASTEGILSEEVADYVRKLGK